LGTAVCRARPRQGRFRKGCRGTDVSFHRERCPGWAQRVASSTQPGSSRSTGFCVRPSGTRAYHNGARGVTQKPVLAPISVSGCRRPVSAHGLLWS
jgi:hypothetical protein